MKKGKTMLIAKIYGFTVYGMKQNFSTLREIPNMYSETLCNQHSASFNYQNIDEMLENAFNIYVKLSQKFSSKDRITSKNDFISKYTSGTPIILQNYDDTIYFDFHVNEIEIKIEELEKRCGN